MEMKARQILFKDDSLTVTDNCVCVFSDYL